MFRSPFQVIGLLSFLMLGGCAQYMAEVRRETCLPQRMYERGYNDARAGKNMSSPGGCTDTSAYSRYREGFLQARAELERQAVVDSRKVVESQALPPTVQVVEASHAKGVVVVNAPAPSTQAIASPREDEIRKDSVRAWEQRTWLCRVEAFGTIFTGDGTTELDAKEDARSVCLDRYRAKFCSNISCAVVP